LLFARKYLTLILLIICLIVLSVFWGFGYNAGNLIREELHQQGRAFVQEIVLTREWAASYGGVYVQMRPGTEVNPYLLKLPDVTAVITDSDGKRYTLKNPALMTREISDLTVKRGIITFKITGLNPLNPANAPDAFERQALTGFREGAKEYSTYEKRGGEVLYRYVAPLRTQQSCLHCHKGQACREGEIQGAISVTIPATAMLQKLRNNRILLAISAAGILALICVIVRFISEALIRRLKLAEKKLVEMASLDYLTGLFNRREMFDRLQTEFARADRHQRHLSLILIDIDHFKNINDTYGHGVGDVVLQSVADFLKKGVRRHDLLCRYGGEEFLLAVPETTAEMAVKLADRLRGMPLEVVTRGTPETTVTVHFSAGVAERLAGEDVDKTISRADAALYRAKAGGRNRVELG